MSSTSFPQFILPVGSHPHIFPSVRLLTPCRWVFCVNASTGIHNDRVKKQQITASLFRCLLEAVDFCSPSQTPKRRNQTFEVAPSSADRLIKVHRSASHYTSNITSSSSSSSVRWQIWLLPNWFRVFASRGTIFWPYARCRFLHIPP